MRPSCVLLAVAVFVVASLAACAPAAPGDAPPTPVDVPTATALPTAPTAALTPTATRFAGTPTPPRPTGTATPTRAATPPPGTTPRPTSTLAAGPNGPAEVRSHARVNEFRQGRGLTFMAYEEALSAVARKHSQDMADRNYFEHVNPDGVPPQGRVEAFGLKDFACGENLYMTTNAKQGDVGFIAEEAFDGWLHSPPHYENMITPKWNVGGMGVYLRQKTLPGDAVPTRYDIWVTHLLCKDMSAYNRIKAQYDEAKVQTDAAEAEFGRLATDHDRLKAAYLSIEERYKANQASRADYEAAFEKYRTAYDTMEAARQVFNAHVAALNALVAELNAAAE